MIKKIVFVSIATFLILTGVFFIFIKKKSIQLYPSGEVDFVFYNDAIDQGNSHILQQKKKDSSTLFEFSLDSAFLYPYCGMGITPQKASSWDFSSYDKAEFTFKTQGLRSVFVYLYVNEPNVKDTENRLAARRLLQSLNTTPGDFQTFELDLGSFETPTWWYNIIMQDKSEFKDPDFSKVQALHITNGLKYELNTPYSIEITSITVSPKYTLSLLLLGLVWFVMVVAYGIVTYRKSRKFELNRQSATKSQTEHPVPAIDLIQKVEVSYKPVEVDANKKEEFLEYINTHFQDPELTLSTLSEKFGYSERTISNYISEKYGCNFKTYVNGIRINEAKRLLENENLASGEVAYLVGFNSPANFNRVFKSTLGLSPTEFKKNLQTA